MKFNEGQKEPFVKVTNQQCAQNSEMFVLKAFSINLALISQVKKLSPRGVILLGIEKLTLIPLATAVVNI